MYGTSKTVEIKNFKFHPPPPRGGKIDNIERSISIFSKTPAEMSFSTPKTPKSTYETAHLSQNLNFHPPPQGGGKIDHIERSISIFSKTPAEMSLSAPKTPKSTYDTAHLSQNKNFNLHPHKGGLSFFFGGKMEKFRKSPGDPPEFLRCRIHSSKPFFSLAAPHSCRS